MGCNHPDSLDPWHQRFGGKHQFLQLLDTIKMTNFIPTVQQINAYREPAFQCQWLVCSRPGSEVQLRWRYDDRHHLHQLNIKQYGQCEETPIEPSNNNTRVIDASMPQHTQNECINTYQVLAFQCRWLECSLLGSGARKRWRYGGRHLLHQLNPDKNRLHFYQSKYRQHTRSLLANISGWGVVTLTLRTRSIGGTTVGVFSTS